MRTLARVGLVAAFTFLAAAPAANAEVFKTTYGAGLPDTFAWEGEATGIASVPAVIRNGCGNLDPLFRCDLIVFNIKDAGTLEASVTMDEAPVCDPVAGALCTVDVDIYLFKSDAEGAHDDDAEPIADGATAEQTETLKAKVTPGFYVLEVEPYQGQNVSYKGTSKYVGPPAPAPAAVTVAPVTETASAPPAAAPAPAAESAPAPAAAPAPAKAKKTGKRAACQKKAKKKKGKKRKKALKACKKKPV